MQASDKKDWKTGLLLTAGALFLFSVPAFAGFGSNGEDTSQLMSRINQLENQVQTLSRAVYKGESRPMPMAGTSSGGGSTLPPGVVMSNDDMVAGSGASASGYEDRLSAIESTQRRLTGQIEQMSYDIQQLKSRVNRASVENGGGRVDSGTTWTSSSAPQSNSRSYNRPPPGEEEYGGLKNTDVSSANPPRGKILGTMSASNAPDNPGALYDDAFNDIRDARYDTAATKFQKFLQSYPTHPLAANAQYWLAETYYVRQDYKQGAKLFAQNYQDYPKGGKASASLLKLGLSLSRLGKKDDACLTFAQLKKEFPGDQTPEVQRAEREIQQLGCK